MKSKTRQYMQNIVCPKCIYWNDCRMWNDCAAMDLIVKVIDSLENMDSGNPGN